MEKFPIHFWLVYFGRHFSVTSKQINVNQALTSSQ
jgi:hypothetical protein